MILEINPNHPEPRKIKKIVEVLESGGIIAYPTDTYYGIGCDLFNKASIEKIYLLKRRSKQQPFSFICSDLKNLSEYAQVTNYVYKNMKRLLPGPYTFVLEGSRMVPRIMLTKRQTVGIRVPDHPICLAIVQALGHPIISTSATDPETSDVLSTPREIQDKIGYAIDLIVDGGIVPGVPSSVISLVNDTPEILREGAGDVSPFRT
ncbi:MAG: L-threonylcarbamoyladenylate synthase [Deltaproteobacteria bacterium]|jgi:tRNA threonylcarbamoyl adenosine modification protein (Sua5/YciO/YrdC/YwlC family)|nr:L-threonylcarbamoyladenylate synthase [Deltaproteobacteria bacterium]